MAHIPDYFHVRQYLLELIHRHVDLSRRLPTERELAERLGVSRVTVRYAVRELLDHGLIEVHVAKGMFVKPSAIWNPEGRHHPRHLVMVIWGNGQMVSLDGYFMNIMERICHAYKSLPVDLKTASFIGWEEHLSEEIRMYQPDGIFWVRPTPICYELVRSGILGCPVCFFGDVPCGEFMSYGIDYELAGCLAGQWMLSRSCRHPMFVSVSLMGRPLEVSYFRGWHSSLRSGGVEDSESFVLGNAVNVQRRLHELFDSGADGCFVQGAAWPVFQEVVRERGGVHLPILLESNDTETGYESVRPDALLLNSSSEFIESAALALYGAVSCPSAGVSSSVYRPVITESF